MKRIKRSIELPFSARQIYDLVNDVGAYPEFLPWCVEAEVHEATETSMRATLVMAGKGLSKAFTTRNRMVPGERIEVELEKGPFRSLRGIWDFHALDEQRCRVDYLLEFEFSGGILNLALGPVFNQVAQTMVDSFRQRAEQLYGQSN